jgi:hypothetical protein
MNLDMAASTRTKGKSSSRSDLREAESINDNSINSLNSNWRSTRLRKATNLQFPPVPPKVVTFASPIENEQPSHARQSQLVPPKGRLKRVIDTIYTSGSKRGRRSAGQKNPATLPAAKRKISARGKVIRGQQPMPSTPTPIQRTGNHRASTHIEVHNMGDRAAEAEGESTPRDGQGQRRRTKRVCLDSDILSSSPVVSTTRNGNVSLFSGSEPVRFQLTVVPQYGDSVLPGQTRIAGLDDICYPTIKSTADRYAQAEAARRGNQDYSLVKGKYVIASASIKDKSRPTPSQATDFSSVEDASNLQELIKHHWKILDKKNITITIDFQYKAEKEAEPVEAPPVTGPARKAIVPDAPLQVTNKVVNTIVHRQDRAAQLNAIVGQLYSKFKCAQDARVCTNPTRLCWPDSLAGNRHLPINGKILDYWAEMFFSQPSIFDIDVPPAAVQDMIRRLGRAQDESSYRSSRATQKKVDQPSANQAGQVQNFIFGGLGGIGSLPFNSATTPASDPKAQSIPGSSPLRSASNSRLTCRDFFIFIARVQNRSESATEAMVDAGEALDDAGFTIAQAHTMAGGPNARMMMDELKIKMGYITALADVRLLRQFVKQEGSRPGSSTNGSNV